jgi:hypothetical protein
MPTVVVQNIQKGPSPWWAVGAGLGAALLLVIASFVVAYYQRRADSKHLDRQLEEAGNRLDRQLEHDRKLREEELLAAADRLDRQLQHDRRLRDLEHMRAALQPILARAFMVNPMNWSRLEVKRARDTPDVEQRRTRLLAHTTALAERAGEIITDQLTLGVVVGVTAPLLERLGDVAATFNDANKTLTAWSEESLADDAVEPQLKEMLQRRNAAVGVLLVSAYEAIGREPPADVATAA